LYKRTLTIHLCARLQAVWPVVVTVDDDKATEPCLAITGVPPEVFPWASMNEKHVASAVRNCCGIRTDWNKVVIHPAETIDGLRTALVYLTEEEFVAATDMSRNGHLDIIFKSSANDAVATVCVAKGVLGRRPPMASGTTMMSPGSQADRGAPAPSSGPRPVVTERQTLQLPPRGSQVLQSPHTTPPPTPQLSPKAPKPSEFDVRVANAKDAAASGGTVNEHLRVVAQDLNAFIHDKGGSIHPSSLSYAKFPQHKEALAATKPPAGSKKYSVMHLANDFPDLLE
jgi:hypothetical protein